MKRAAPPSFRSPEGRRDEKPLGVAAGAAHAGATAEAPSGNTPNDAFLRNVEVRVPNLVVVTADHADPRVNSSVQEVLRLLEAD